MAKETMIDVNGNPIPVLQFDHPAQEIDNAVEMVKNHAIRHAANGPDPITPAAIGAAPEAFVSAVYSAADFHALTTIIEEVFAEMAVKTQKTIAIGVANQTTFSGGVGPVLGGDYRVTLFKGYTGYGFVDIHNDGQHLQNIMSGGIFRGWEWVAPHMEIGFEYRTTQRHNGKPVYVKRMELPALGVGTETQAAAVYFPTWGERNIESLVRYDIQIYPETGGSIFHLPYINSTTGKLIAWGSFNHPSPTDPWLYGNISTFADLSGYKALVTAWYTKITN